MRKFGEIYKEQLTKSEALKEGKILDDFKMVYASLLEKYNVKEFYDLNEENEVAFLNELNVYWREESGLTSRGEVFLTKTSDLLNEKSTTIQKKNFLKKRATITINETLRQSEVKWKIYGIIDEMYREIKASGISEVLSPDIISDIIYESFLDSLNGFMSEVTHELSESAKPNEEKKTEQVNEREFSEKKREELAKSGAALKDGSFPIVNKQDLKNAIQAFGRAKNKSAAKAHIKKRARALGAIDLIPEDWK